MLDLFFKSIDLCIGIDHIRLAGHYSKAEYKYK
jgi:hypothetical protein